MIKKVYRSESDLYNLSLKKVNRADLGENLEYKKVVVNKPWGYEYLLFENEYVAIWILCLRPGGSTSMHCHPNKKTSLIVLSGSAVSSTLDTEFSLTAMDGLIIDNGVFHATRSDSAEDTFLMEIETPPDKNDLVRLKDQYGREGKKYEGKTFMSSELAEYTYCDFHGCGLNEVGERELVGRSMKIVQGSFHDIMKDHGAEGHVCLLAGNLADKRGDFVLSAGEVATYEFMKNLQGDIPATDCRILIIY